MIMQYVCRLFPESVVVNLNFTTITRISLYMEVLEVVRQSQ